MEYTSTAKNLGSRAAKSALKGAKKTLGWHSIAETGSWIYDMARSLKPNPKGVETFQNAERRLGVLPEDLRQIHNQFSFQFFVSAGASIVGAGLLIHEFSAAMSLAQVGFQAVCFAIMFIASFRAYQIRSRELFGMSRWLANPQEWIPVWKKEIKTPGTSLVKASGKGVAK